MNMRSEKMSGRLLRHSFGYHQRFNIVMYAWPKYSKEISKSQIALMIKIPLLSYKARETNAALL